MANPDADARRDQQADKQSAEEAVLQNCGRYLRGQAAVLARTYAGSAVAAYLEDLAGIFTAT